MKITGIILFLIGSFILLIGIVVCVVTLADDYATKACRDANYYADRVRSARQTCRAAADNDCYQRSIAGLTTQEECDRRRSYMNQQLMMGIVPSVIGGLIAFVGLLLTVFGFIRARRKGL
jgi:ABC-type antimicrobial peptide transport system permease subunit